MLPEWADNPHVMRLITVWTARSVLPPFIVAFLFAGWRPGTTTQRIACRIAAFTMTLHTLAIIRLSYLEGEPPLSFRNPMECLVSIGGGTALGLVLVGWFYGERPWYRWAMYWPWGVFVFTYIFLARHGETPPRIVAAPLYFAPILFVLFVAFAWRAFMDFRRVGIKLIIKVIKVWPNQALQRTAHTSRRR
jgi:hypothetical protein